MELRQFTFSTNSLSFLDLLKKEDGEITDLLEYYTPRQIIVSAPIRYIDDDKSDSSSTRYEETETKSVTNVDIEVNDAAVFNPNGDVARIEVWLTMKHK